MTVSHAISRYKKPLGICLARTRWISGISRTCTGT